MKPNFEFEKNKEKRIAQNDSVTQERDQYPGRTNETGKASEIREEQSRDDYNKGLRMKEG